MSINEHIEGPVELPGEPMESHTNYPPTTGKTGIQATGKLHYLTQLFLSVARWVHLMFKLLM
jgi:hypothetical protein